MRHVAIAVGVTATASGAVLLLTPISAPIEPPVVPTLGLVALLGLGVGALAGLDRAREPQETTDLPAPEDRPGVDAPGEAFDRALAEVSARSDDPRRAAIRERLASTAVTVLVEAEGWSPETVRDRLETGEWTDDVEAAAFFADDPQPAPPLRERLRRFLAGEPTFARRARRVVTVLSDREETRR